ncbi:ELWxxDGT repeat protein [Hyalangium gracile]|uniref:ELWxxDGT repeat protein n=1 Tax=Hyalangium gracile TaxID=394092 RepID=UPI001CCC2E0B|nr:ELWxxDGT repeat protein [Hyalangium gracile]
MRLERRLAWLAWVWIVVGGCGGPESPRSGSEQAARGAAQALASLPTPVLVKDIWPGNLASNPGVLTNVNGTLFFAADDGVNGVELWKSDGTDAGTVLVKDIRPGALGSDLRDFASVNGTLFFSANSSGFGPELWKSDGTAAGTVFIKSFSYVSSFTVVNGTTFFVGGDGTRGIELWKTDGTTAGTVLVRDIRSGSLASYPSELTAMNGVLYFRANDGTNGEELWRSDGTTAGTYLVRDLESDVNAGGPDNLLAVNGRLFFNARAPTLGYELWTSDGTSGGTVLFKDIVPGNLSGDPIKLTAFGNGFFFTTTNATGGYELWKSDGTAAGTARFGTFRVKGTYPATDLINVQGTLYFVSDEGTHYALWKSDGTLAGTVRMKDFEPSVIALGSLTASGSRLFFYTIGGTEPGPPLWVSDGTEAGTRPVRTLRIASPLADVGGKVFVSATDGGLDGFELWKSDGTDAGTVQVKNIRTTPGSSTPGALYGVNGTVYFTATEGVHGRELWKTDGTETGTVFIRDINTRDPTSYYESTPREFIAKDENTIFFNAVEDNLGRELWKTDGTAAGTTLVRNIASSSSSSSPERLTIVNGTLFFRATDSSTGYELWKSDGTTAGTVIVKDIWSGFSSSNATNLTEFNGTLLFSANNGSIEALWKSDGTSAGTVLLKDFSSVPSNFTRVGSTLFLSAAQSATGTELWKSDGTATGTVLVKDIRSGSTSSQPGNLTEVNGTLFFTADNGTQGRELWKSDGTATGTVLVKDIAPGATASSPTALVNFNGTLLFAANDGASGVELWRSDGTEAGTWRVRDIRPGATGSAVSRLVVADGVLYFVADDGATGSELWRSDGTEAGTMLVADLAPGAAASAPDLLTPVGATLYWVAEDGVHGRELWRLQAVADTTPPVVTCPAGSTAEATGASGATVTYPPATATDDQTTAPVLSYSHPSGGVFPLGVTTVTVTATDEAGNGATCNFTITVRDTTAPALTCPSDVTVDAQDTEGATVTYPPATASDAVSTPQVTYSQGSGTRFGVGTTVVTATAMDGANNTSTCAFNVIVRLPSPPTATCPADVTAEATSASGAVVSYPPATGTGPAPVSVSYSGASGTEFPLGTTSVTATVTDGLGRTASCSFAVLVRDTTPPAVSCPANVTVEATGAEGASVTYSSATASDAVTASPSLTYSHASGASFPLGSTTVTATAKDGAENSATCSFTVTVRDTTAPVLTCPANLTVEATSDQGANVSYPPASATDAVSSPEVTYSLLSGTTFGLGVTRVTVTATDGAANSATCEFLVTVRDNTAPVLTCPANLNVEATSAQGAAVSYPPASATDAVSSPEVTYSQLSGTTFGLGVTRVTVTAKDGAANSATCEFLVTVRDTTAPVLTCPADVVVEATSDQGAAVDFPSASATDAVTASLVPTYSHARGATFPLGVTNVTASVSDAAGNTGTCGFTVTVRDTSAPVLTCPADVTAEATSAQGSSVEFPPASARDTTSMMDVTYSHASGSTFALGATLVTATASDSAGNTASCTFTITVRDTTPPELGCPAPLIAEAQSSTGADVVFSSAAPRDAVTLAPTVSLSHAPGSRFPLGMTEVQVSAADEAGNSRTCSFTVTVRDTTSPTLTCPADVKVTTPSQEGTTVTYAPASASDAVSPVAPAYSQPSGTSFAAGTTPVTVTATDEAGNASSCTFQVVVEVSSPVVVEPPPESLGCSCGAGSSGPQSLGWGALLMLAWATARRRLGRED